MMRCEPIQLCFPHISLDRAGHRARLFLQLHSCLPGQITSAIASRQWTLALVTTLNRGTADMREALHDLVHYLFPTGLSICRA